jgi:hypothetical protein
LARSPFHPTAAPLSRVHTYSFPVQRAKLNLPEVEGKMFICKSVLLALGIMITALTANPSGARESAAPAIAASAPSAPAS